MADQQVKNWKLLVRYDSCYIRCILDDQLSILYILCAVDIHDWTRLQLSECGWLVLDSGMDNGTYHT